MRLFVVAAFGGWLMIPSPAMSQARLTAADLGGTVTDQSGAVVANATITVTNTETNVERTSETESGGRYSVPALPPGRYHVAVSRSGFTSQVREDVDLFVGESVTIDFTLVLAPQQQTVTVTPEVPPVQTNRTELSTLISQQQIDGLPINGRNVIGFSVITPGVAPDHTPQQGSTLTSGLSFGGQRARSNNIMVDGLDNNDIAVGAVRATFSQEAIREFQVLANSYSAEFGKAAGGVVNIVTRSGTNVLHGNAYFYFRDKSLNARSHFEQFDVFGNPVSLDKAPYRQAQWGATVGGPIRKDRTFFFVSQERTDITDNRVVTIDATAASVLASVGFPVQLGNVPLAVINNEVLGKIDHHWSPLHHLEFRVNYADIEREGVDDFGGIVARSRGTVQLRTNWSVSASQTDVLSARWVNESRFQYAYEDQAINALDPACGGACIEPDQGGPTLEVTGVASVGRQRITPNQRLNNRLQFVETVSYVTGTHHVKAGAEYNHLSYPEGGNMLPLHFGGRYIFSPIPALGVATALDGVSRGIPAAYVQGYGNPVYGRYGYRDVSLFAQDEWKRGRLVVKPGIRYQRQFFEDATYTVTDVGGGTFSYPTPSDADNIAPRIGLAYDLTGDGRTVVHGSYGIFYDNIISGILSVGRIVNGSSEGVRTLVLAAPRASVAWSAPGHALTESQAVALLGSSYPSVAIMPGPTLENSYAHQAAIGVDRLLAPNLSISVNGVYVRGFHLPGTLDYNPVLGATLGPGRRPNDLPCSANPAAVCVNGAIPGTSASVLQYTSFGESWYQGLTVALSKRFDRNYQFLLSYTLSKAEDTSTDFQTNFLPQNSGFGRDPANAFGLPRGFDPDSERGPATQDQRHRLVLSGIYELPHAIQLSGILSAASGRPFTPLAGQDLNLDGNGGAFPPDRARVDPLDESTSVGRNSGTTANQFTVDLRFSKKFTIARNTAVMAIVEAFNVFNRVNFYEDTNQSSFVIFGPGAYPSNPLPTYGKYTLTLPPRQVQIAAKFSF
ncbi:MAG TPA: carboxypeptidase regulatory-like domain-containing protein [Vicinamibacterales bacterium]|nr:carboxypeptidase regulatory-like domain-containing protein [Vicinamibacterales bacterium]